MFIDYDYVQIEDAMGRTTEGQLLSFREFESWAKALLSKGWKPPFKVTGEYGPDGGSGQFEFVLSKDEILEEEV